MKTAVLFDLGNTLAAYYRAENFRPIMETSIACVLDELHAAGLDNVTLESAIASAIHENREAVDFRFIPLAERLERIFAISLRNDATLANTLCLKFLQPIFATAHVYADTFPILQALRKSGHPTAIVSNTPWGSPPALWRQELVRLKLAEAVDEVVLCGDVGWRKPAGIIFERAATKLGRRSDECIFVGDDVNWDVAGSAGAGMRPILIDRENHHAVYDGERIAELSSLLALV